MKKQISHSYFFLAIILIAASFIVTSCANQQAQEKGSRTEMEADLRKLYERLMEATKNRDEKTLREVLADDYSQVTANGRMRDKEIRIKETLSPDSTINSFLIEEFRPRVYTDSAIAECRVRMQGVSTEGNYDTTVLSTATFVRKDGTWKIAATHLTFPPKFQ